MPYGGGASVGALRDPRFGLPKAPSSGGFGGFDPGMQQAGGMAGGRVGQGVPGAMPGGADGGFAAVNQAPPNVRLMGGAGGQGGAGGGSGRGPGGFGAQGQGLGGALSIQGQAGAGLLDPNSDYYKRLMEAMRAQIGGQSAAAQRSAGLRAAQSGFGGGASPELMEMQQGIAQAGLGAAGEAGANLALQAPQLGGQLMGSTFGPALGLQQLSENQTQFGLGQAMQQQGMAQQGAQFQAQLSQQQALANQQAQMQQYLAQLNAAMGGF